MPPATDTSKRPGGASAFEYAMIDGVNDHDWQAELIAKKLKGMPGHVNLIPLNDVVESPYKPSRRIGAFQQKLESFGCYRHGPQKPGRRYRRLLRPAAAEGNAGTRPTVRHGLFTE